MTTLQNVPNFSEEQAIQIAFDCYDQGLTFVKNLPSERDQNFLLKSSDGFRVLKISNQTESKEVLEAQNQMILLLSGENTESNSQKPLCPKIFQNRSGDYLSEFPFEGETWTVRMVEYLEGTPLADLRYVPEEFFEEFGKTVADITNRLEGFDHPALHYDFQWDLKAAFNVTENGKSKLKDPYLATSVESLVQSFRDYTYDHLQALPTNVIHNDLNDGNVVICKSTDCFPPRFSVAGIIDFGDAIYGWTIGELAIAAAYAILNQADPLKVISRMVRGYCANRSISPEEADCLFGLVCIRLCQSATLAAKQSEECPENEYLNVSQSGIGQTLPVLAEIPFEVAQAVIRKEAGLPPKQQNQELTSWLQNNQERFCEPIKISGSANLLDVSTPLDLSVESELVPADIENYSIDELNQRIRSYLSSQNAIVGIGGYLEPRLVYQGEHYLTGKKDQSLTAPRTVHLGIDFFCEEGTDVCSVFEGTVAGIRRIERDRDYGNVVVLKHQTESGIPFYTLYGHLSGSVHSKWKVGQKIGKDVSFGKIGGPKENGGWPPHLHFQVLTNFCEEKNPPGVCNGMWVDAWSQLNPDPNLLFGYPEKKLPKPSWSFDDSRQARKKHMGGSLSLGYNHPLKIVRGKRHYLFDHTGRRYLDSFNNVPHVGHANEHVVESLRQQASLLNTNTRYLNDVTLNYAKRLCDTMPDPLEVCFLVNSASEANELALRITRNYTQSKNMIVLEAGYHGNTTSLIDISPYKHEGPGGDGPPDWVYKAEIADCYRGQFKDPETAGESYAENVRQVIQKMEADGKKLGGYIAESCPSVGGQILFPKNYLKNVYRHVRASGGLCIADEVQTGFGRLGTHFYGFQMQEVVPDIVILGKPIGNGHPLAALVTTKETADAFNNGMEYFSTFGGNMVSCAVGNAVLDQIEKNELQQNAHDVGNYLLEKLRPFQDQYSFVGDVRGSGFFLGVELIRDTNTLEPADKEASFISNRMKDRGVLLGTDGPFHNVIKIRPPMTFQKTDADVLVKALAECFEELDSLIH